ncbi:MAG TPA: hypothetical protein VET82_06540 [Candidatus Eisenbacteria bacterium]|nr:hypothetical protein [Candidatus Eisenbacteria bacterium]
MNDDLRSPLARRLATLEIPVPPELVPRVMAARRPAARVGGVRLVPRLSAAVALVVLAFGAASYFAPRFSQALADAPLLGNATGPLLRSVGLAGLDGRITTFSGAAVSSGYRVELIGGYADAIRTIVLLRVQPADRSVLLSNGTGVTLTDQFGRRLELKGGVADEQTGQEVLEFEPITGPAASLGARLTLQAATLTAFAATRDGLQGDWELHATIALDESRALTPPGLGRLGTMTVMFTRVTATATALEVQLHVQGGGPGALSRVIPDALKGHPAFSMHLWAPDGTPAQALTTRVDDALGLVDTVWVRSAAGVYRLVVSDEGMGTIERTIDIS